ncbi:MAG: peptide chain release factor N(5)-glutamine methyltransferase, partial [Gammaproteobacteria bacterium]
MNTRLSSWHSSPTCKVVTISALLKQAGSTLNNSADARIDAEVLLCHVLQCDRSWLYTWPEKIVDAQQAKQFKTLVSERARGTPVAYLTGEREFWSLAFEVTPETLIPRPETELLVETVLQKFTAEHLEVLDLGTGCGAIAIALAHARPGWQLTATDVSSAALEVARRNAVRHSLHNLRMLQSDWFENLGNQRFDVIVSNPP